MNTKKVNRCSEYILDNNNTIDLELGKIHSIFNKSLNIRFNFGLVNIIEDESLNLPFSIELDKPIVEHIIWNSYIDDVVIFSHKEKKLLFKYINLELDLNNSPYECSLDNKDFNKDIFEDNFNTVVNFIHNSSIENGFGIENKRMINELLETKESGVDFYKYINKLRGLNGEYEEIESIFNYFIGRGRGLTPSGDDFILGVIAILKVVNQDILSTGLYKYLQEYGNKRTTDISLEYLKHVCYGRVGSLTKKLCESVFINKNDIENNLIELSKKGHTSGIDTIMGILVGMIIINEKL
jgi:hypothetical protein